MTTELCPGVRSGTVAAPASKSFAHRAIIISALGKKKVTVFCEGISKDIAATVDCLNSLGADIDIGGGVISVSPVKTVLTGQKLRCGESGSTLRFLLPVAGALGADCEFITEGRLIERPLAPLDSEMIRHGAEIKKCGSSVFCSGRLRPGEYEIPGDVSSQYISGLLMSLWLLDSDSRLKITSGLQSQSYIKMTEDVLSLACISIIKDGSGYIIPKSQTPNMPDEFRVEGDYSNAAFFMCMGAMSEQGVTVSGLNPDSSQGDKYITEVLKQMGARVEILQNGVTVKKGKLSGITVDASQIPDIIPTICAVASVCKGVTRIINGARLRLKESDRIASTVQMLRSLGANAEETPDGIVISGVESLAGGTVDSCNDHRIAMSAAVASCACKNKVKVIGSECVSKSYPEFWRHFGSLKII